MKITIPPATILGDYTIIAPTTNIVLNNKKYSRSYCKCNQCGIISKQRNKDLLMGKTICECMSVSLAIKDIPLALSYLTDNDLQNEKWAQYTDYYKVSSVGRVWSCRYKKMITPNRKRKNSDLLYYDLYVDGERIIFEIGELINTVFY